MTSIKSAGRSYKNTFQPAREPKRYPTPVTWLLLREKWPARHGKITLLDQGPYRGHKGQAAKCKCRCDCGEVMYIDCGVWVGMSMVKLCPEQCEECRRQGHREISYAAAHSAKRASARAWIGRDITLAKAKRGLR
jgi:hypothetical protein